MELKTAGYTEYEHCNAKRGKWLSIRSEHIWNIYEGLLRNTSLAIKLQLCSRNGSIKTSLSKSL